HSRREREGGIAEEAAITAPRLAAPVRRRSGLRGPGSWCPDAADAIAENGWVRCLAVDKARSTCFEGTIDRDLYSFRCRSPVPRARSAYTCARVDRCAFAAIGGACGTLPTRFRARCQ